MCATVSENSSAPLQMDFDRKDAMQQFQTLMKVATFHKFSFLKDCLNDLQIV